MGSGVVVVGSGVVGSVVCSVESSVVSLDVVSVYVSDVSKNFMLRSMSLFNC